MHQLKIDRTPLHLQVREHLLGLIEAGTYQPGEQLPAEVDLATQLGISRPTLREALLNLEREGVVVRKHGVGTFVAAGRGSRLESGLERLESILAIAARQGMQVGFDDLHVDKEIADPELAGILQVPLATLLTQVRRVLVVDMVPVAYMFDVAPASVLAPTDVDERFNGSVLDLLVQKQDLQISQAVADTVAVNADAFLAEELNITLGQAVLLIEETLYDEQGTVVEFSRNYFVPDFFRFHVVRRL